MSGFGELAEEGRAAVFRPALVGDVLRADELRGPDVYRCVQSHAEGWSVDEQMGLALSVIEHLLTSDWARAGSFVRDPQYQEKQERWERERQYLPGTGAPKMAVWVAWDIDAAEASERIKRDWPTDPGGLDDLDWELELTTLGEALADLGGARS